MRSQTEKPRNDLVLISIGLFKLVKCILLTLAGFGALHLIDSDVSYFFMELARDLHLSPSNHYLHRAIAIVTPLRTEQLRMLGVASFVYAALFLIEGIGLVLQKMWGEYFSVIITTTFIPFEVIELAKRFTWIRLILLLLNIAIVIYLILRLREQRKKLRAA